MDMEMNAEDTAAAADGAGPADDTPAADTTAAPGEPAAAGQAGDGGAAGDSGDGGDPDMFPRAYVERLRKQSAGYRERARQVDAAEARADALARRLHTALVAADGRLADPEDLPFDAAHLDDAAAMRNAIAELVEAKPHLKARRVAGDIGAGDRGTATAPKADLLEVIRGMM